MILGMFIRRKLSKKQKNKKNNHPLFKIIEFYQTDKLKMVALESKDGIKSYMQIIGLEDYEVVK